MTNIDNFNDLTSQLGDIINTDFNSAIVLYGNDITFNDSAGNEPMKLKYYNGNFYAINTLTGMIYDAKTNHTFKIDGNERFKIENTAIVLSEVDLSIPLDHKLQLGGSNTFMKSILNDIIYNVPTNKFHSFKVNDVQIIQIADNYITFRKHVIMGTNHTFGFGGGTTIGLMYDGSNFNYNVETDKKHKFNINAIEKMSLDNSILDLSTIEVQLDAVKKIYFDGATHQQYIYSDGNTLFLRNKKTGNSINLMAKHTIMNTINGVVQVIIDSTKVDLNGIDLQLDINKKIHL